MVRRAPSFFARASRCTCVTPLEAADRADPRPGHGSLARNSAPLVPLPSASATRAPSALAPSSARAAMQEVMQVMQEVEEQVKEHEQEKANPGRPQVN